MMSHAVQQLRKIADLIEQHESAGKLSKAGLGGASYSSDNGEQGTVVLTLSLCSTPGQVVGGLPEQIRMLTR